MTCPAPHGYFATFTSDCTFIFHTTPEILLSRDAYLALWRSWEKDHGFRVLSCRSRHPHLVVHGDTAIFTHQVATRVVFDDRTQETTERESIVFRLEGDGRWLAIHEHLSPYARV